jgi:hypothetical protein
MQFTLVSFAFILSTLIQDIHSVFLQLYVKEAIATSGWKSPDPNQQRSFLPQSFLDRVNMTTPVWVFKRNEDVVINFLLK